MHLWTRTRARKSRQRGQSTVEMTLMLLPLLFLTLLAIDGGGVFLAWIGMNGISREAANFAAVHPTAWTSPGDASAQAQFAAIITGGTNANRCQLENPSSTPVPTFPNGTTVGGAGTVNVAVAQTRCRYTFITPLLSQATGGGLWLTATTAIPIRAGTIAGLPISSAIPIPSSSPTPTPGPTATPDPNASPTPTPVVCIVPNFVNVDTRASAPATWAAALFTGTITFSPGNLSAFPLTAKIGGQSLVAGSQPGCTSSVTLTKN